MRSLVVLIVVAFVMPLARTTEHMRVIETNWMKAVNKSSPGDKFERVVVAIQDNPGSPGFVFSDIKVADLSNYQFALSKETFYGDSAVLYKLTNAADMKEGCMYVFEFLSDGSARDPSLLEAPPLADGPEWTFFLPMYLVWFLICAQFGTMFIYWCLYIKPEPNKYIPARSIIPDDSKGKFTYGFFDCCARPGTFCCFLLCPAPAVADLWYRSGFLHAVLDSNSQVATTRQCCPGWRFFVGIWTYNFVHNLLCFAPCPHAVLRGGLVDGQGLGSIKSHREMFDIPHHGFKTFCADCCIWCWCGACAGVQQYRQVMDVLSQGPVQVAPSQVNVMPPSPEQIVVVGAPVRVGPPKNAWGVGPTTDY